MLNPSPDTSIDSIFNLNTESTSLIDVPVTTIAEPPLLSTTTLPPPPTPLITHLQQTPVPTPATVPSSSLQYLPNFVSLFGIVDTYLANKISETIKTTVQLQSHKLRDEAQAENEDFINKLDDNIKKIIKDQVKEQVKAQVSKILPKIEKTINEQLDSEVSTRSSMNLRHIHAVAANLSELELKKILIDKMESNNSIHRFDVEKNLYKALVDAYKSDKLILNTYGKTVSFKRRQDKEDKDEEPSARSNRGSKRRRAGKEPKSTSAPKEKTSKTTGKSTEGSKSHHKSAASLHKQRSQCKLLKIWKNPHIREWKQGLLRSNCQQYPHDLRKPLPLIPNSRGHQVIPFDHFINNDLAYLSDYGVKCRESARDVYSKRRIIAVTELQIVEWHNYKHLDWITVHRDDDKLYKLKEGDFKRLRIQDIKDMLLLLKHYHPKACGRPSIRCRKLPKEAQPHKAGYFSDGTLNDVWTALDDRLKGIWMQYLPQTIWRESDRDKAGAMIQAIDKQLKTRRIMWSLEKFIGGRPYSNPMIQPESEGSTQGYPLDSVEVLRYDTKGEKVRIGNNAGGDRANTGTNPTRFNTTAGNPVKKILLKLNLSDHRTFKDGGEDFRYSDTVRPSQSDEVLKLKNFEKDASLQLSSYQIKNVLTCLSKISCILHATYGKIRVDDDFHDLRSVETKFPAIVINDTFASQNALLCESKVSTPINNEIDFRISFDESDD
ncbi:hypothetical protein Tco_1532394 [Tanacetum coccineum]